MNRTLKAALIALTVPRAQMFLNPDEARETAAQLLSAAARAES